VWLTEEQSPLFKAAQSGDEEQFVESMAANKLAETSSDDWSV
jgi:hypothetical protein